MVQIARSDIADNFSEKEIGKNEKNCESDCCFGAKCLSCPACKINPQKVVEQWDFDIK